MAHPAALWAAWARVCAGTGMPGADGVSVTEFAQRLGPRLEALSRLLAGGGYRAQPLRLVNARRGGRTRQRGVPTVGDRVAQRAFLAVAQDRLDGRDAGVSFAYRRGRSWVDALGAANRCRDNGLRWVFRTDIADFFAAVDHPILVETLAAVIDDPVAVDLVEQWIAAPVLTDGGLATRTRGVPEGSPVSPALANLYLRTFDERVHGRHGHLVRFADDIALFCTDLEQAVLGGEHLAAVLDELRLELNPDKTSIATFDAGFSMLGWRFQGEHGAPEHDTPGWTHPLTTPATAGAVLR
jgi:group II intron reverse transcriptase/maturase